MRDKRLYEITEHELEKWRIKRMSVGQEKYKNHHLQRYGLVDVMEELLDAQNILYLITDRLWTTRDPDSQTELDLCVKLEQEIWKINDEIANLRDKLVALDKLFPEKFCTDEMGERRIWWDQE